MSPSFSSLHDVIIGTTYWILVAGHRAKHFIYIVYLAILRVPGGACPYLCFTGRTAKRRELALPTSVVSVHPAFRSGEDSRPVLLRTSLPASAVLLCLKVVTSAAVMTGDSAEWGCSTLHATFLWDRHCLYFKEGKKWVSVICLKVMWLEFRLRSVWHQRWHCQPPLAWQCLSPAILTVWGQFSDLYRVFLYLTRLLDSRILFIHCRAKSSHWHT